MFKNGKPEEFLNMMKEFKITSDCKGTMSATVKIHFLCTILIGGTLREFDNLAGQVGSTTNGNLKFIKEGLLR